MADVDWHNNPHKLSRQITTLTDEKTRGATSVADGGTVTHGLGATPTLVCATCSTTGEIVSVTAIGATTFTVAIKKIADGSAGTTAVVYWVAWK